MIEAARAVDYTAVNKVLIILNREHRCEFFQDAAEGSHLYTAILAVEYRL
jgi:hypothetical protein